MKCNELIISPQIFEIFSDSKISSKNTCWNKKIGNKKSEIIREIRGLKFLRCNLIFELIRKIRGQNFLKYTKVCFVSGLSFINISSTAQCISLSASIDTAKKYNHSHKKEILMMQYNQQLKKAGTEINHTNISFGYGQMNSTYLDNSLDISQSFKLPGYYSKQKKALDLEWQKSILSVSNSESEVTKAVGLAYFTFIYLDQQEKILLKIDSIYNSAIYKIALRFKVGDIDLIEKTSLELQQINVQSQLEKLKSSKTLALLDYRLLLNSNDTLIPNISEIKFEYNHSNDALESENHYLLYFLKDVEISKAATDINRTNLLPTITLGASSTSMKGLGSDDKLYTYSTRFQSGSISLDIPIFARSQKEKIKASTIQTTIAETEYKRILMENRNQVEKEMINQNALSELISKYEKDYLAKSELLIQSITKKYMLGEVDNTTWNLTIQQALDIKKTYLDNLLLLNQSNVQLQYLLSK
jgi:heavy metal efflux system protein